MELSKAGVAEKAWLEAAVAAEAATAAVAISSLSRVSDGVASSRLSSLSRLELEAELAAATEAHRLARDEQLEAVSVHLCVCVRALSYPSICLLLCLSFRLRVCVS